jgi:hypothetical protein
MSFKSFREHFLDDYIKLSEDKVTDVIVHFLNTVIYVRPYLEHDLDLIL